MLHRFIVLDMDRTLLDATAYGELLMDAAGLTPEQRKQTNEILKKNFGGNFDLLKYITQTTGVSYKKLEEYLLAKSGRGLLMPGAGELIEVLAGTGDKFGILTTGAKLNQQLKLAVIRKILQKTPIQLPAEVTEVTNKSADFVMARWRPVRQAFYISAQLSGRRGGCYAKRVILVDDKHSNLTVAHAQLITFHIPLDPAAESHTLKSVGEYIRHTAL